MFDFAKNLDHVYFRQPWGTNVLVLLIAAALFASTLVYFGERGLALWKRILLGGIRVAIFVLIILLLFEPVEAQSKKVDLPSNILVLLDVSESMAFADQRITSAELEEPALALGKMAFSDKHVPESAKDGLARTSRLDIARGLLQHPDLKIFQKPGVKFRLRFFAFGDALEAAPDNPEKFKAWLKTVQAKAPATHLGDALKQAEENFTGQNLSAIIVLSDGVNNGGEDPLGVAGKLSTPVYTLPIGLVPGDVRLVADTLTAPDVVFPKDKVPVEVQVEATPGFVGRDVDLVLKADGKEVDRKKITLKANQFESLSFIPEQKSGLLKLDVSIMPLPGEATDENNHASRTVKIIDEKINVLYVEGKPRWEYRYLKAVLTRDRRINVQFLLTEGDPDLPKLSDQFIARLPENEADTFKYDLVILGEVRSDYFTPAQHEWIEKLVRDRAGSLLMLAGHQYAPMSYADSPIGKLLPVKLGVGREFVDAAVHPVPTLDGVRSQILALELGEDENREAWSLAKPLYDLPKIISAKPGATVLATLSNQEKKKDPYPLVSWHRYGTGKTMLVGSDQFWRLRFKRGDAYHAHFWSQSIQFLTLSRLLGENKRLYLATDRKKYNTTNRVLIQATLLDEDARPLKLPNYPVVVDQVPPKGEPRGVSLKPVPGKDGMYQGYFSTDQPGNFEVRPADSSEKNASKPNFQVESISREKIELDVQRDTLAKLANLTGGKLLTVRDLPDLLELMPDRSRTIELPPQETEIWNNWWIFSIILTLAGFEWFMRRSNDVA